MTLPVDWTHYLVPIGVSTVIFFARNKGLRYLGVWWLVGLIHATVDYHRGFATPAMTGALLITATAAGVLIDIGRRQGAFGWKADGPRL